MRKLLLIFSVLCLSTSALAQVAPPASAARYHYNNGAYANPGYGNPYGGGFYGNPYGYYDPNSVYVGGGRRPGPQIYAVPPEPALMQYPLYYQSPYQYPAPGISPDGQVIYLPQ